MVIDDEDGFRHGLILAHGSPEIDTGSRTLSAANRTAKTPASRLVWGTPR
jgi:hypothetical protein